MTAVRPDDTAGTGEREAAVLREHERFMWGDATTEEKRESSREFDAALAALVAAVREAEARAERAEAEAESRRKGDEEWAAACRRIERERDEAVARAERAERKRDEARADAESWKRIAKHNAGRLVAQTDCRLCGGVGSIPGFLLGSVKTCTSCHGTGTRR